MICATAIPARKEITFLASFTELMIALWRLACFHLLSSIRLPNGLTRYLAKRPVGTRPRLRGRGRMACLTIGPKGLGRGYEVEEGKEQFTIVISKLAK